MKNYFEKTVTITMEFYVDFNRALEEIMEEMDFDKADEKTFSISGYFADWWLPEVYCDDGDADSNYLYDSELNKDIEKAFEEWLNSKEALEKIKKWRRKRG